MLEQQLKDSKEQLNSDLNSQQLKLMEELNQVAIIGYYNDDDFHYNNTIMMMIFITTIL